MPETITRRSLLAATLLPAAASAAPAPGIRREVFLKAPGKGTAIMAYAYYTSLKGGGMLSIEQRWSRSDTIDVAYLRRSSDYGKTWSAPEERITGAKRPNGMLRVHLRGGWVDPRSGRFLQLWNEGVLPNDDPLEGLRQWNIYYTVDGGPPRQIIHKGPEFHARHPLPGVYTGKNSVMLGDNTCQPITLADGTILLPCSITPTAADGSLYNPGGGYTWHDSCVLRGRWKADQTIEWEMGALVKGDPAVSTRGFIEPTIAELTGNRLLMVLRGSNDKNLALPGHRWFVTSPDAGRTWSKPQPWTYTSGKRFFSPSACSQLLRHSNGKLYWLGNLTPENPKGNRPRYPFVIGEVDRQSGLLIEASVRVVDTLAEGEDPILTLSNFYAREDRQTREIALHMTRLFALSDGWLGDAWLYRIPAL
jgi:hypothetical protein